jgi:glycosyltransferase involved in cell wall biosynthesis
LSERKLRKARIAILGARGIPACYSGYDTLVEEVSIGLVAAGYAHVLVYCRSAYYKKQPRYLGGIRLVYLPAPRAKAIESLIHSFLSTVHVLRQRVDLIYFVDPANAPFCALLRLLGKKVIVHTDGLGWKRRKWGPIARRYYKLVELVCARVATRLITDNPVMQEYYAKEYGASSVYIPYGAEQHSGYDKSIYNEFNLSPKSYFLVVARLERENNVDFIIAEYVKSRVNLPLIVVGDAPYDSSYMLELRAAADSRVVFSGRIDNQAKLNSLYEGAYVYMHGHEVGGTNPSLLRAMHAAAAPLVIDADFNKRVIGAAGYIFKRRDGILTNWVEWLASHPSEVMEMGRKAKDHALINFDWRTVVDLHNNLFRSIVLPKGRSFKCAGKL